VYCERLGSVVGQPARLQRRTQAHGLKSERLLDVRRDARAQGGNRHGRLGDQASVGYRGICDAFEGDVEERPNSGKGIEAAHDSAASYFSP
jgi:hypothetical protein